MVLAALFVDIFMIILLSGYRGKLKRERSINMFLNAKFFQLFVFIASGVLLSVQLTGLPGTVLLLARNSFLLAAIVCECLAYLMLLKESSTSLRSAYLSLLIVSISAFCLVYFLETSEDFRIITFSIMAVTIILYTVVLCLIHKQKTFLQGMVILLYIIITAAFAMRALVAGNVFHLDAAQILEWQSWISFSLLVLMILGSNGFILLAKELSDEKLLALANVDSLTGIINRRSFLENAGHLLRYFARKRMPVSFILADIDGFKRINDTYGHFLGDIALKNVSRDLQNQLRGYDAVSRWGSDEFALLLPGTAEEESNAAERIRNMIESRVIYDERVKLQVTVSIGLATVIPQNSTTIEMIYKLGDWALHEAKKSGGNCVVRAGGISEKGGDNEKTG